MTTAFDSAAGCSTNYMKKYLLWLNDPYFDSVTRNELEVIRNDNADIEDRFFRDLEFGTGGMRGIMGAGTNRINIYTIRKATQGFADYLKTVYGESCHDRGVVIACDSRRNSYDFSLAAAGVLAGNGIKAYVFEDLRPTPELSYAVRYLDAVGGIVVTASHNPKDYNGYKVYGADGAQMSGDESDMLEVAIRDISDITAVNFMDEQTAKGSGLLVMIGTAIDDAFISDLKSLRVHPELPSEVLGSVRILYTPLNGSGNVPVRRLLSETGFCVDVVEEQELPDPGFSTVPYPNPEDMAAFEFAIKAASPARYDIILATDPDSDRLGVVILNSGEYLQLTGNQTGCLLMEYILSGKSEKGVMPDGAFVVTTIVSTGMASRIAMRHNVEIMEVLTGFKHIGERIKRYDDNGCKRFVFGFEESIGFLAGTFSRDKDGVGISMLVAEMAAFYALQGMTLPDALERLYDQYGYFLSKSINMIMSHDKSGMTKIRDAMRSLRGMDVRHFGGYKVLAVRDYLEGSRKETDAADIGQPDLDLPRSDVLYYELEENAWVCFRPSGTEPKIKAYYEVFDTDREKAGERLDRLGASVVSLTEEMLGV